MSFQALLQKAAILQYSLVERCRKIQTLMAVGDSSHYSELCCVVCAFRMAHMLLIDVPVLPDRIVFALVGG